MVQEFKEKFKIAYQKIRSARRLLIVGHINPDGDDLASVCILKILADSWGQEAFVYCDGRQPEELSFLPQVSAVLDSKKQLLLALGEKEDSDWLDRFDLMIVLDCGSIERTNLDPEIRGRKIAEVIEFDHHQKVSDYADLEIRAPEKSSTAELLYDFLAVNKIAIERDLATCILTGIMTDTGNFLYPNAKAETLAIASKMLAKGVNANRIIAAVLQNKKIITLKLLSRALDNLRINYQQGIAVSVLRPEDFQEIGHDFPAEAFDEIVAVMANLSEVKAVLLLREYEAGKIRGGWRSKPGGLDVSELAKHLGGGGHKHASGFQISGHIVWKNNFWRIE